MLLIDQYYFQIDNLNVTWALWPGTVT